MEPFILDLNKKTIYYATFTQFTAALQNSVGRLDLEIFNQGYVFDKQVL